TALSAGGGIFTYSDIVITNSTFTGNTAGSDGGALVYQGTWLTLTNVTMLDNSASEDGASIKFAPSFPAPIAMNNVVIASDAAVANCNGEMEFSMASSNNISDDASCGDTFTVVDDVMLGELEDNGGPTPTHLPLPGSPLIDAGDNATCPDIDQRGEL